MRSLALAAAARSCGRQYYLLSTDIGERVRCAKQPASSLTVSTTGTMTQRRGCADSATATHGVLDETMFVLLDSTVLIDYLRARPAVERVNTLLARGDVPCTSPINVEEIMRGVREQEVASVERLFDGLNIVPIGRAEGRRAGEWRRQFAARGTNLSQADCLIAAAAHSVAAVLATGNPRHFPMDGLEVEHWPVGA